MDFEMFQNLSSNLINDHSLPATAPIAASSANDKLSTIPNAKASTSVKISPRARCPYRSYTGLQIQELLDLTIELGMSARGAGLIIGIKERIAQYYVERLPGQKKRSYQGGNNRKFDKVHTDFLCSFYDEKADAVL